MCCVILKLACFQRTKKPLICATNLDQGPIPGCWWSGPIASTKSSSGAQTRGRKDGRICMQLTFSFFLSSNRTMMMRVKGTCSRNKANKIRRNGVYATRSNTRVHGDYMHRATHYVTSTFTVICFQSMSYLFYYHETNSLMNCSPRWLRARVRQILGSFPTGRDTGDPTLQPLALKLIY